MKLAFRFLVAMSLVAAPAMGQQTISLPEAVQMALDRNPLHKAAVAETRIANAGVKEARAGWLPRLGFSELATRGNDPVYVFGTKLRQQRFTAADFALDQLNRPTPIGDFSSRFSGQWRLFDSMLTFRAVDRARHQEDGANRQMERADQELIARAVQTYYGALLAKRKLALAEDSLKTAEAIEGDSRARVESGMAVDADLLSAQVVTAQRKQELVRAQNDYAYSIAELAVHLGLSSDAKLELQDILAPKELPVSDVAALESAALQQRPDLRRVLSEQQVQRDAVRMATSAFGPKLDAFGSWQTDNRSLGWSSGGNNWTAGLELQIDLFSGGAKQAALQREKARQEQVDALRRRFEDQIKLEVRRAFYDFDSAQQQQAVAKAAAEQAAESLRILQNRYESGLATVTDVLRAEESAHRTKTDYWESVARTQTGYAVLELAAGQLTTKSRVVTQ